MTAVSRGGLILDGGRKRQLPDSGIAVRKGLGSLRVIKEVVFAGQSTGVHTNGNSYVYDGVTWVAARTDANGQTEITADGLKLSRTASSVSPNYHALIAPGDGVSGGWTYQTIGMSRFIRGNWQWWVRYTNVNIGSMTTAFASTQVTGGYPYHGIDVRRYKSAVSTPATQGGNSLFTFGPASELGVTMTSSDTGYQYDTLCVNMINPCLWEVWTGQYSGGWPDMESMVHVGIANHLASTNHTGRGGTTNTTFLRDFKIWVTGFFLGGSNVGDYTVERFRFTEYC